MTRSPRRRLAATLLALACLAAPSAAGQGPRALRQLGGVAEMKTWFNANAGHARAIFLLSPT